MRDYQRRFHSADDPTNREIIYVTLVQCNSSKTQNKFSNFVVCFLSLNKITLKKYFCLKGNLTGRHFFEYINKI